MDNRAAGDKLGVSTMPERMDRQEAVEVWHRIEELGYLFPAFSLRRHLCFQAARDFAAKYGLDKGATS